jgi:hypothetical protein
VLRGVVVKGVARKTAKVGRVEVDLWVAKPFEEAEEIVIECDNGDDYRFAVVDPVYGPDGFRVVIDEEGDAVYVARSAEELERFVLDFIECEELERRGVEHVDATIR